MSELALLQAGQTTYYAKSASNAPPFLSAVAVLVRGIYELKPETARTILRHRIYTTLPQSASLSGLIKVAAKRVTTSVSDLQIPPDGIEVLAPKTAAEPPAPISDRAWMKLALKLASETRRNAPLYLCDRAVGAVLVSSDGELLATASNSNARDKTQHAEMKLLQTYHALTGWLLPPGAQIYVSLKPCKMCAGMIWDSMSDPQSLRVFYAEVDQGPHARATALDFSPFPTQQLLDPER